MKKTYKIEVDCANCAAKMERAVQQIPGVLSASVNFFAQKMIIETDGSDLESIMDEAERRCKKVEPDCEIYR